MDLTWSGWIKKRGERPRQGPLVADELMEKFHVLPLNGKNLRLLWEGWNDFVYGHPGSQVRFPWNAIVEARLGRNEVKCPCFGLFAAGEAQAAICLESGEQSRLEPGKELIYIHRLEAAPWNRPPVQDAPASAISVSKLLRGEPEPVLHPARWLLIRAVMESRNLNLKGRLGLHQLKSEETRKLYTERMGMTNFGSDPTHENLEYMELSAGSAENFLLKWLPQVE